MPLNSWDPTDKWVKRWEKILEEGTVDPSTMVPDTDGPEEVSEPTGPRQSEDESSESEEDEDEPVEKAPPAPRRRLSKFYYRLINHMLIIE